MWATVAALAIALERLIPLLSSAIDFANRLRDDAKKNADLKQKADADAKLAADQTAIATDEAKFTTNP